MSDSTRMFLSGNEAVALAACRAGFALGTGYPGTPSTEILEAMDHYGGRAQWSPNEKVALEVGIGVAYARQRSLVTMKHVGLNVAADPLFTVAYTGVDAALVIVTADDPGMASSQNEQDNRRYAVAAGIPMLEPASSQEAYDYLMAAVGIAERWKRPVLFRMTTRVCHSKTIVDTSLSIPEPPAPGFEHDIHRRVMIPAFARPAHGRLMSDLDSIREWNEQSPLNERLDGTEDGANQLAIITSGVAAMHVREAAPHADVMKLAMTHPLPLERIRAFAKPYKRVVVIEEGDPYLVEQLRYAGIPVEDKPDPFRCGELNVSRIRHILAGNNETASPAKKGVPPALCQGCPHRTVFEILRDQDTIVAGDIGCYSLGVLPPFDAMDTLVCMGASLGVGLGLRHVLPADEARRVVSVIGDSTFMHSGVNGLIEMVYNRPATGHIVLVLDNSTTAMTGLQEHPATGRSLDHSPATPVSIERLAEACGMDTVTVFDPTRQRDDLANALADARKDNRLHVMIVRRSCVLAAGKIRQYEREHTTCDHAEVNP